MMLKETDEPYHQMTFDDIFAEDTKPNLFAVSRVFASARKQMNLAEYKAFTFALMNVDWTKKCPEKLYFDKKTFARIIGIKESDPTDLSQHLKRAIGQLPLHSFLEFSSEDSDEWLNGVFIIGIGFFKKNVRILLNPTFLPLFGNLDKNYITMWSEDIFKMRSKRSVKFYELLRSESDTRIEVNTGTVGIRFLKELFDIPKDGKGSYVRSEKNGGFDRNSFERYVIDPLCEDLAHTDMIRLIMEPDGKYYKKIKRGNRVIAYEFHWTITMHPRVANAAEKKELQEQVDADPQVLKVAKDIVSGKKKPKAASRSQTTNRFNNFPQRTYNYKELERQLIQKNQQKQKEED